MLHPSGQSADAEARLARAAATAAPAIWDLDRVTGAFTATARLNDILGLDANAPLTLADLVAATHPAERGWEQSFAPDPAIAPIGPRTLRLRIVRPDRAERWLLMKIEATPTSYTAIVEDITDAHDAAAALAESEERFKLAIEAGRMAVWEVDLENGALTQSPELNLLLGFEPHATITLDQVRALYVPGEMQRIAREGLNWENVKASAESGASPGIRPPSPIGHADRMQIQTEVSIVTPQGLRKDLLLRAQHALSLRGPGERVTGLLIDITERKRNEERLAVVARELQHRVKNSLAVVQTLAVQSFRNQQDNEAATQAFLGRVRAFAVATGKILDDNAEAADLTHVVLDIIKPYRRTGADDAFIIDGGSVTLSGRTATSIGMALHELCTNAMKYGALSTPSGRVRLSWGVDDTRLVITWAEEGGPAVVVPIRRGFGSRLLDTVLTGEKNGVVQTQYEPFGLQCTLSLGLN